ncbi:hypothetical protein QUF88_14875 [Bacillus sp. DX1.1]|uniref:hypothetical protein n=1 Tax=unclassified Bacillus (in: firmicutes) TaxID=185979 RepID=UPI0025700A27|nr:MULTISPECIES: hypothetical protein [unclassified Bacillus (in: firmicutes)]MDM5155049.1 hypothetical protein [Bacillus sp. DX1.1]WJE83909.1 hypothetical protein QRE67_12370 [Bacillus sp. DX3.1]
MLAVKNYTQKYIDECRSKVNLVLSTYEDLVKISREQVGANNEQLNSAIESFEPNFFNNMILALNDYFVHRMRTLEKKDGNPLNEVRILCDSIMNNNNIVIPDNTIKYKADKSVLGYKYGDNIKLSQENFEKLSEAFFAEIEKKFL